MTPHTKQEESRLKAKALRGARVFSVVVLGCVALALLLPDLLLNTYVRSKLQNSFSAAHPEHQLRLGAMRYSWGDAGLTSDSVSITTPAGQFSSGPITIRHARWAALLGGKAGLPQAFVRATLSATNLMLAFSNPRYELRCGGIEASVPASKLSLEAVSLRPQMEDKAFFGARPFRATRFNGTIAACHLEGISFPELLQGAGYRARRLEIVRPELDALVAREKPPDKHAGRPRMLAQALAALGQTIALDVLTITNGTLSYSERRAANGPAGTLVLGDVHISATGIVSPAPPRSGITIDAGTSLMNAAPLKVTMFVPLAAPDFSLSYSGSLGAMDLTRLNPFLENAERLRVTSGRAQSAVFSVAARGGHATGSVRPVYAGLKIAFLDAETGTEKGVVNRARSFFANAFKIRETNLPDGSDEVHVGKVDYQLKPEDTMLKFIWYALRSGVLDGIHG